MSGDYPFSGDNGEETFALTPKGYLWGVLLAHGVSAEQMDNIWMGLEGFALRNLRKTDPESEYAAIIMDGAGGSLIGIDHVEFEELDEDDDEEGFGYEPV